MMKRFFLFCSSCLFVCALMAHPIDKVAAHKIAVDFLSAEDAASARQRKSVQRDALNLRLVYPVSQATRSLSVPTPAYYVFAAEQGTGFVIVAGDDEVKPIIGYSQTSNFDAANIPPALQAYLIAYERYVGAVRSDDIYPSLAAETAVSSTTSVFPFITTTWSQGTPFNNLCPTVNGNHCVTGCVATAMAQIMNYYEWPVSAAGSNCAYSVNGSSTIGSFNTVYDWSSMKDSYLGEYTDGEATAVAQLTRDAGYTVKMQYGVGGSGAFDSDACTALFDYFGYSSQVKYILRDYYTQEHWHEIICGQLEAGHPVLYTGQGTGGHAFICCGVDDRRRYYINWGWGGYCDGYFDLDAMTPTESDNYSYSQGAIINIIPKNESDNEGEYCMAPHIGKFNITAQDQSVESPKVVHNFCLQNTSGRTVTYYLAQAQFKDDELMGNVAHFASVEFAPNTYWEVSIEAPISNPPAPTAQSELRYLWSTDRQIWHEPQGDGWKVYMNTTPVGHLFSLVEGAVRKDGEGNVVVEGVVDNTTINNSLTDETITSIDMQYAVLDNVTVTPSNPNALLYAYEGALSNTSNVVIGNECENLLIQDGYPFVAKEITAVEALYVRELGDNKYGTVVLPFAPDAVTMDKYSFYAFDSQDGSVLNFRVVDNPEANIPYLYKNKVDGAEDFTASDIEVSTAAEESVVDSWTMKGTYEKLVYTDPETLAGLYYISNNQVMNATKSLTIKPFRAYFEGDANAFATQSIGIRLEGTTEILPISTFGEPDTLYDLFGRRIESVPQGYYIKNGKKYYGK